MENVFKQTTVSFAPLRRRDPQFPFQVHGWRPSLGKLIALLTQAFNRRQLEWLTALIKPLPEQAPPPASLPRAASHNFDLFDLLFSHSGCFRSYLNFLITFNEHFSPIFPNDFKELVQDVLWKHMHSYYTVSQEGSSVQKEGFCIKIAGCLEQPAIHQLLLFFFFFPDMTLLPFSCRNFWCQFFLSYIKNISLFFEAEIQTRLFKRD